MMDLDQLQSVRDRERASDELQELRADFYRDAAAFVRELRTERDEVAGSVDDPFDSQEVSRLTDRIRTAERTLEAIYEKRVGKVVKAATFAAADLPAEAEGMTDEEADLFETLVSEIRDNRETVLSRVTDESNPLDETASDSEGAEVSAAAVMGDDAGSPAPPPDDETAPQPDGETPAAEAGGDEADSPRSDQDGQADDVDRELVRITDDVGAILGVDDREYDLATDDVVTLPAANAEPLIDRGVAERVDRQGGGR
jgi:DNA replication factor GINS